MASNDRVESADGDQRAAHCGQCGEPMDFQLVRNPTDSPVAEREEWMCENDHLAVRNFNAAGNLTQRFGFAEGR